MLRGGGVRCPDSLDGVISGIPRRGSQPAGAGYGAPIARISMTALDTNLRAVLSASRTGIIDVRADAWGHGVRGVALAALDAGAGALLVDDAGGAALSTTVDTGILYTDAEADAPEAVYGLSDGFLPAMSLRGRVLSVKSLHAGEGVSYGYTHRAAHDTIVALVTGGYAQGVVRSLGNAARVGIGNDLHPIVGRVAMDVCVVDVGERRVVRGDEVVFFGAPGRGPHLREWTAATGLTAGELVAAVGLRAIREVVA